MRCSDFRESHCAYVDDTLAGVELVRMQEHVASCPCCASHDACVRRSLMLARSMPRIEPSPDFARRLDARLRACRDEPAAAQCSNFRTVASLGAVASLLMLGYIAESLWEQGRHQDVVLPPVVAMAQPPGRVAVDGPDADAVLLASETSMSPSAVIASLSAGMPILPAALFAEQAPIHFANYRQAH